MQVLPRVGDVRAISKVTTSCHHNCVQLEPQKNISVKLDIFLHSGYRDLAQVHFQENLKFDLGMKVKGFQQLDHVRNLNFFQFTVTEI